MGQNAPDWLDRAPVAEDAGVPWEGLTVARYLREIRGGVQVVVEGGDAPLHWVEPSDLADPTAYLIPHELVLTTGAQWLDVPAGPQRDRRIDDYVAALVGARASALGFGTEPYFQNVPAALSAACRRHGLSLWQIDVSVPFAHLGITFAKLLRSDTARMMNDVAEANRALLRALDRDRPETRLIEELAPRIGAAVQLLDPNGRLRHVARGSSVELPDEDALHAVRHKLASHRSARLEVLSDGEVTHLVYPLRARQPTASPGQKDAASQRPDPGTGTLVLSLAEPPSVAVRSIAGTALSLLEVILHQRLVGSFAATQLATLLVLGITGQDPESGRTDELLDAAVGGNPRQPLHVVLAAGQEDGDTDPDHQVVLCRSLFDTRLVARLDGQLAVVTRQPVDDPLMLRAREAGMLVAVSRALDPSAAGWRQRGAELHEAYLQAAGLLRRVLDEQRSLRAADLGSTFADLLPLNAARQLAHDLLAPLLELPAARRELYLRVLRSWLEANGQWDASAAAAQLHRNSMRRHVSAIAELLGVDLSEAAVRQELYLALRFISNTGT